MLAAKQFYGEGSRRRPNCQRLKMLPGWVWNPWAADWEEGFEYLSHFVEREGHSRVPARQLEDGYGLGRWVNKQRTMHGSNNLPPTGWPDSKRFPGGFGMLGRPTGKKGLNTSCTSSSARAMHVCRRACGDDGYRLGSWVSTDRNYARK